MMDDKEYAIASGMMLIGDDAGPESIAGIMGGAASGCSEETVNVFVESAFWDPIEIAHTGRKLKINSDARYRFERGVDPEFSPVGLDHAVRMILDNAGGEASEVVMAGAMPDLADQAARQTAGSHQLRRAKANPDADAAARADPAAHDCSLGI